MSETATGLVLRTWPLTETSLIVRWLTPEFGRLSTVAKGARRPKSPFRGKLDLFYLADFSFTRSRGSELHNLREVKLRETHSTLRQELFYLEQASYCAALIEQATEAETPLPEIFELMKVTLDSLSRRPPEAKTVFAFELKLLNELGLSPDLDKSHLPSGTKQLVRALTASDWTMIGQLKLSAAQASELRQFLHGFVIFHLGKIPNGRAAALAGAHDNSPAR